GYSTNGAFTGKVLKSAQFDALGRLDFMEIGQATGGSAPLASVDYQYDAGNARLTRILGTPGEFTTNDLDADGLVSGDKCPNAYDPSNADTGGIGASSAADGIGNACQCGDLTGDGVVTMDDALAVFWWNPPPRMDLCDVTGDGKCDENDYSAISAAVSSP